ncbi:MAG TPA: hypothetical protein VMT63_01845 [Bacteroidales bacterium]|nr:hypothetical protein [Bacteroidales bacterium]
MKARVFLSCIISVLIQNINGQDSEMLIYHRIRTGSDGKIIPWYSDDPAKAFNKAIMMVWKFWDNIRTDPNGLPYYMNHQVWNPAFNDPRGIGGDQFAMALSSWRLLYAYTGNERIKANMCFIADYYLTHGFSPSGCKWPDLPFPYNTYIYSGLYDGDMRSGRDVLQPDKAGSFGLELVHLFRMTPGYNVGENKLYLEAAVKIANTLASKTREGNENYSPLPFKVNAYTGNTELLRYHDFTGTWIDTAGYTTNWTPTMQLFLDLVAMKKGDTVAYMAAFNKLLNWMKNYPLKNNKWGPFFEDVDWWSDTQINAMTFARFIMEHNQYFPGWKSDVKGIIDWVHKNFANDKWKKYGVTVTNEQTVYQMPGNSHSSRQAADEILYVSLTGDSSLYPNAVRELSWATYAVGDDGRNCYPGDEPWLTDGYGDYVRHFLRAMDASPVLAPGDADHILSTTGVIRQADYKGSLKKFYGLNFETPDTNKVILFYRNWSAAGTERIRLRQKPSSVMLDSKPLPESASGEGYEWIKMKNGGLLVIRREHGTNVLLLR